MPNVYPFIWLPISCLCCILFDLHKCISLLIIKLCSRVSRSFMWREYYQVKTYQVSLSLIMTEAWNMPKTLEGKDRQRLHVCSHLCQQACGKDKSHWNTQLHLKARWTDSIFKMDFPAREQVCFCVCVFMCLPLFMYLRIEIYLLLCVLLVPSLSACVYFWPCIWILIMLNNSLHGCIMNHLCVTNHPLNTTNLHGSTSGWVHVLVSAQMWVANLYGPPVHVFLCWGEIFRSGLCI